MNPNNYLPLGTTITACLLAAQLTAPGQSPTPNNFQNAGLMAEEIDEAGNVTRHAYDRAGALQFVTLPEGLSRGFVASQAGSLPESQGTDSEPNAPAAAQPESVFAEYGGGEVRSKGFVLGPQAKASEVDDGGMTTTYQRNIHGKATRITLPSGQSIETAYDAQGNVCSITDPLFGQSATITYDPLLSLPVATTYADGATLRAEYDAQGNLTASVSPAGRRSESTFNPLGQILSQTAATGAVTAFTYGAAGNLDLVQTGTRTVTYQRDGAGRPLRITDPESNERIYTYDAAGRLRSETDPDGELTLYEKDANGGLTAIVRPGGARHAWSYDGLGRAARYTPPGQPEVTYSYSVFSEPTGVAVGGQTVASATYNAHGEPVSTSQSAPGMAPLTTAYAYDPATGQMLEAATSDGITLQPTYQGEFPMSLAWSGTIAASYTIQYGDRYRVVSRQVGTETPVPYTFDDDNLVTSAGALTVERDPATGLVETVTIGTVAEAFTYNSFGELESHTATAGGTPIYAATLGRDQLGRVTSIAETIGGATTNIGYAYTPGGRLASVTRGGAQTESYTYDQRGNLTADTHHGSYTYNAADQLLTAGAATFTYTPGGERLTRSAGASTTTYRYTALSLLRGVDLPDGRALTYLHNPGSSRAARLIDGVLQEGYVCPGGNVPEAALNPADQTVARYVHARGGAPAYVTQGGNNYRLVTDHTGSVRLAIDTATGAIAQRLDYDAYGRVLADTAPGFQPFGFAGGWADPDTGLVRFGARDYDPDARRWTTPDPISFASGDPNLHTYATGDPVNRTDRSGLTPSLDEEVDVGKILQEMVDSIPSFTGPPEGRQKALRAGSVVDIDGTRLWVERNGKRYQLAEKSHTFHGDIVSPEGDTRATLEYAVGGRSVIGPGERLQVGYEGLHQPAKAPTSKPDLNMFNKLFEGFDNTPKKFKIQTSGGVMGGGTPVIGPDGVLVYP